MNDERFFDLAMKVIARQSTEAERAELDACLTAEPERRAELERLRGETQLAKDILPLVAAATAPAGELPAHARPRLQTKVRQTLGRPATREATGVWSWGWVWGLATATAILVLISIPFFHGPSTPVVQLAMVDLSGPARGTGTNELELLRGIAANVSVQSLASTSETDAWQKQWPPGKRRPAFKVLYDRSAGEVRVWERRGNTTTLKTFPVEPDLATTLAQVRAFLQEQRKR
jgi:hypothetical protein